MGKMKKQKELTKKYFDNVAKDWCERAYDPKEKFLVFPSSKVRQNITISEIKRLNFGKRIIDLGCGTGELIIELLKNNYDATGIDNSPNMIEKAQQRLLKEFPKGNPSKIFKIRDIFDLPQETFDGVTAMGLLEYLEDDFAFFKTIKKLLNVGGYAFVDCRNRLFNIVSGNDYTLKTASSGDLKKLISQLNRVQKYSPTSLKKTDKILTKVFSNIAKAISDDFSIKKRNHASAFIVKEYPKGMIRRQHTPEELEGIIKKIGLRLESVIYFHCHPYLPRYEKSFPIIFNKIAFLMQPLGYTPLGATICSAFVAVIAKPQ